MEYHPQIISSLLNLQSQQPRSRSVSRMFEDSRNRIQAMALVHEKLYQSKNLSEIEFGDYVRSLVQYLIMTFGVVLLGLVIEGTLRKARGRDRA